MQPRSVVNVTFDGRVLDQGGEPSKKKVAADDHGPSTSTNTSNFAPKFVPKSVTSRACKHDAPPLTPPRIAGVSMAPVADADAAEALRRRNLPPAVRTGQVGRQQPEGGLVLATKPDPTKQQQLAQGQGGQPDVPQLRAEGRSMRPALDPRIHMYNELNETDSLCGTPPALHIDVTRGSFAQGPFGPLEAQPLSPSILTLCGGLDVSGEASMWDAFTGGLPDMRPCDSPKLPSG